ncbi:carboxypeptidase family protein [Edaphobacter aggregans]|uniref:Carboxypeptidase family protein n=1 Tax=Edaphobacter aggregans TaxID=570835 RepID=A0A3R9R4J5_9BACT|nr:TonB-dependent receptor [Edaphobacter aggregans]RSL17748.1 carboxypeptidase family protein [Edaphobacter aggregans]
MSILRIAQTALFGAALAAGLVVSSASLPAWAQSQSINGTIRGLVSDSTGAPIAGATVTVKNLDTGYTRIVTSAGDGLYIAPDLPVGTYSVSAQAAGFALLTQTGIHLAAGNETVIDQVLKAGSVATVVEVTSDAPILEPARFTLGRTISPEETQNLPLTSRNPYNFILFQPGVSGHPNPENGIPRTVNTNGLVDRISYQLDGMVDTETDRYGLRLFAISDSYVSEVQTIANSAPAEFGNTAGVTFNVITPTGTNHYHGLVQYIWRPKAASSCPILQNCVAGTTGYAPKPDLHVDDYVGRIGGPVKRDKLFFFAAYEKLKRANPQAITITPANQATLIGYGINAALFNPAPSVQRAQWLDVRGDWTINTKNQAFVRYNYFRNNYPFNTNVGGLYAQDASSDFQDRAHIIGAQLITTFTPNILNEFRGSWPYRNEHHVAGPITGPGPMITITGVANFGGTNAAADKFQEKIPSFNDNVTWIKGAHTMKFGVGLQKNLDTQLQDVYVQYTFASIAQWQSAKNGTTPHVYSNVKASIGQPGAAYHSVFFNLFAQDTWQVKKNLLLSYGLRYDQYRAPTPPAGEPFVYTQGFRTPLGNFAPRFGVSYQPNPTTVVRLNAGLFYEATPTNTWYNPLYNNGAAGSGSFIATVTGASSEAAATSCQPAFPNTPQQVPASCLGTQSIYALTPRFKNEYVWNVNAQVQQQLTKSDSLTLGYIMTNGRNMQFLRNMNLINPVGTLLDGRPVFQTAVNANTRLFPQFNNITLIDVGSNSSYNALTATYEHRMSLDWTMSASYTWSHSITNTPEANSYEFSTPVQDTTNPNGDRGNSGVNRPQSLTVSTVYAPTAHFENRIANVLANDNNLALLGNFSSGDQQIMTVSAALNNDAIATSRPLFIGRNTLRAPNIAQVDARYTRGFGTYWERVKPQLLIEANNLFNRSNVTSINGTAQVVPLNYVGPSNGNPATFNRLAGTITSQPTLAPTSSVLEARILQFGLKVEF